MFGNNGYLGSERSQRSQEAIQSFEVPLNHFDRMTLDDFQDESGDEFDEKIFKLPIALWKYVAEHRTGISSWHHTGKYFQMTDHYDLASVAYDIQENFDEVQEEYQRARREARQEQRKRDEHVHLGWLSAEVWGGTRKHPQIVDHEEAIGYIKQTDKSFWLISTRGKRFNIDARRVETYRMFDDLTKFKRFLGKKVDLRHFKKWLHQQGKRVPK